MPWPLLEAIDAMLDGDAIVEAAHIAKYIGLGTSFIRRTCSASGSEPCPMPYRKHRQSVLADTVRTRRQLLQVAVINDPVGRYSFTAPVIDET